jgi:LacI family transcriptional regulator
VKGSGEVTIYDVAKVLNLSPSTVSRGLSNHPHINSETQRRIRAVAAEMGYRQNKFASNLRQKHTKTIGVVVPRLDSWFMATALAGIEKVASEAGFGLIITQSLESWKKEINCISTLFNSRVDGLLVSLAYDTKNLNHFDSLFKRDVPIVFFDRVSECKDCVSVLIDNYRAGLEVTIHLINQGCKRIMHLGGNMLRNVYSERLRGYKDALEISGIDYDQNLIFSGDMSNQAGRELALKVIKMKQRPDGIFFSNDTSAVAAVIEFNRAGIRIPDEIAVAGFNNEPVSEVVNPNLTTVDYPAREIGEIAATSLINKLKDPHKSDLSSVILKHKLVVRESTLRNIYNPVT